MGCTQYRWRTHTFYPAKGAHEMKLGIRPGDRLETKFCGTLDQGSVDGTLFEGSEIVKDFEIQTDGCDNWDLAEVNESINFTLKVKFSEDAEGIAPFHYAVIPKR